MFGWKETTIRCIRAKDQNATGVDVASLYDAKKYRLRVRRH